jgi:YVTN family beta-propeller protein
VHPTSIEIASDGQTAYVTDFTSGTVVPVAISPLVVGPAVTVAGGALAAAFTGGDGSLVVTDYSANEMTHVQFGVVVAGAPIHMAAEPGAVAVTPDGKTLWVTLNSLNEIVPITVATGAVGTAILVGTDPDAIAVTASGAQAVVANRTSGTVSVVDLSTDAVTATVPVGSLPEAVAILQNTTAFVANFGSANVTPVSLATTPAEAKTPITVAAGPDAVAVGLSASAQTVLVGSRSSNTLTQISVTEHKATGSVEVASPTGVGFSPDLLNAYVVTYSGFIDQVPLNTFKVGATSAAGSLPLGLTLSAEGGAAFVADAGSGQLREIDAATGATVFSVPTGAGIDAVALTTAGPG